MSQESGRKAAHWIRNQHPELFNHKVAYPPIEVKQFKKCIKHIMHKKRSVYECIQYDYGNKLNISAGCPWIEIGFLRGDREYQNKIFLMNFKC